jgi:hypothetical protein
MTKDAVGENTRLRRASIAVIPTWEKSQGLFYTLNDQSIAFQKKEAIFLMLIFLLFY